MAGNWGAALAALAGGAGSLANSMDTRMQDAEAKRQRQLAEALKMLEVKDIYGGTDVPEGTSPSDAMTGLAVTQLNRMAPPGVQQAGGGSSMMPRITSPSYTDQRDEQLSYGTPSVQDIGGKRILFDPSMGKEARTERRTLKIADAKDRALQSREAIRSIRDFTEAMELAKVQAGLKPDPAKYGETTVGTNIYAFDRTTGALGNKLGAAPRKEMSPGQAALQSSREQRQESSLRKDYENNPIVKDAAGAANAIGAAQAALSQNSPVGDLMALYGVVKMFDPNSVVREGEIKLAQSANSLPEKLRLVYQNTMNGRKVTPYYRAQIEQLIDEMIAQRTSMVAPIQKRFGASARRFGVDSSSVAPNLFEGLGSKQRRQQIKDQLRGKP